MYFPNEHLCGFGVLFCLEVVVVVTVVCLFFFKMENISVSHILSSNCREYKTLLVAIMRHMQVSIQYSDCSVSWMVAKTSSATSEPLIFTASNSAWKEMFMYTN